MKKTLYFWGLFMLLGNIFVLLAFLYGKLTVYKLSVYLSLNVAISAVLARIIATIVETYEEYMYQKKLAEVEAYIERLKKEKEEEEQKKWEAISVDDIVEALTTLGKEHIVEEK
ncbi:hypothetical protein GM182_05715 [bacterium 3DAC]|jgi:hypothetical protein|nr:hypothetical protein [Dictyoglomota bacterium]UZN23362.1 hypothetical protein GM182_05715 [bacterium 3DAC]